MLENSKMEELTKQVRGVKVVTDGLINTVHQLCQQAGAQDTCPFMNKKEECDECPFSRRSPVARSA